MSAPDEPSGGSALKEVVFGSIAGMTAKVFEHPFDLVKVRLQSQSTDSPLRFTGPLDCFRQTYIKEGWKGLYRGISAPIVGAACENASLFLVYNRLQNLILYLRPENDQSAIIGGTSRRELSTPELALAAAGAGSAASFVMTPIELIKCRMQVQMLAREGAFSHLAPSTLSTQPSITLHTLPPLQGPLSLIASTVRTHGLRGLWLGQMGTLFRETGGSSAWFTSYEVSSKFFLRRLQLSKPDPDQTLTKSDLPAWQLMASGAVAGMSYNIVLFPADSVKSAMQTWAELHPDKPRLGFWAMASRIWKGRGLRGLYAGCGLTVARAAPSSAMIFGIYETLVGRFGYLFD
ncbi:mitochondrial carrier domain-containing protein [Naematelia encephala]|uniref:Mitochondrial carrier domain-containing protein n=1 Tax=Naematelia encephala TaxID=71784 RepID=A0A1Y2AEH8_9TREE|nr:mitochondrial carrier domain-containing protein [Naematelia encephala]